MNTIDTLKVEQRLQILRERLKKAQEKQDKDMGKVIIRQVEALYRSQGREEKIPLPKWITE